MQLHGDLSSDEALAGKINLDLEAIPDCRSYMHMLFAKIQDRVSNLDAASSPHDTMIDARYILHQDGAISDVTISGNTNAPIGPSLVQAIRSCSPFLKWPDNMRSIVGEDHFVVYCHYGFNMTAPSPN